MMKKDLIPIVLGVEVLIGPLFPSVKFFQAVKVPTGQAADLAVGVRIDNGIRVFLIHGRSTIAPTAAGNLRLNAKMKYRAA